MFLTIRCYRYKFDAADNSPAPFLLSDGRVHHLARGHIVRVLDVMDYHVIRCNPHRQTVMIQKINSNDRPFGRNATELWLPPPSKSTIAIDVNFDPIPMECDCPSPLPPRVYPDMIDATVEASLGQDESLELLAEEFSSVQDLHSQLEEARKASEVTFNLMKESVEMSRQRAEHITALETEIEGFKVRLKTLTEENESLLRHSFEQSAELSTLRLETATTSNHQLTTKMLCHQMSTYPPSLDYVDNNLLFHLLCSPSTSTTEELKENARHLLRLIHPDKNPSVSPAVAKLVPIIKETRNILTDPTLNRIYQCCGIQGVRRAQRRLRTCMDCDPHVREWLAP